jgi:hypothetical protein
VCRRQPLRFAPGGPALTVAQSCASRKGAWSASAGSAGAAETCLPTGRGARSCTRPGGSGDVGPRVPTGSGGAGWDGDLGVGNTGCELVEALSRKR